MTVLAPQQKSPSTLDPDLDCEPVTVDGEASGPRAHSSAKTDSTHPRPSEQADSVIEQACWQLFKKSGHSNHLTDQLRQFANVWCRTLGADQVIVLCKNKQGHFRVRAVSGTESFDSASSTIEQIENVVQTHDELGEEACWYVESDNRSSALQTYSRVNGFKAATLFPLSIQANEQTVGYVVTFFPTSKISPNQINKLSSELFPLVAQRLDLTIRSEGNRIAQFCSKTYRYMAAQKTAFWLFVALCITAVFLFPYPYKVSCNSTLEPVSRRYVAAPFDGRLKESLVEPGDRVKAQQTIAIIDDDDFRLQLKSANAEHNREKARHSAALQEGRIADAQIAALEIKKLKHDIDLLRQKISSLEVKSPIDGIVVSGDLEKSEGTPLKMGQAMFEIGPLDQLKIEIEIPESKRRFVQIGQPVSVRFHAFPLMRFDGQIESIFPRAESRENQVVFVATANVQNEQGILRPGMKGKAMVDTGPSLVGWNILHRPIESFRSWIGM